VADNKPTDWQPIESAPRDGRMIKLLIPYDSLIFDEVACTDEGYWDAAAVDPYVYRPRGDGEVDLIYDPEHGEHGCFRFEGDDGPFDIQPTHWRPL
jgi:hypothetical protein